jgi:hypothetical protein
VTGVNRDAFVAPGHLSERPTGRAQDIPVVAAKSGTAHDADLLLSDRQGTENQGSTSDVRVVAMLVEPALSNISFDVSDTLSDVLDTVNKDMEPRNTELGFAAPEVASSVTELAPPIVTDGTGSVSHVAKSGLPSAVHVAEPSSNNEEPVTQSSAVEMNISPIKSLRQSATREATDVGDQANNAEPLNAAGTASPLRTIVTSTSVGIDATEALLDVVVSTGSSKTLVLRLPRVSVPVTDRVSEASNRLHPSPKTMSEVLSTVTANRSTQSASKLSNATPTMPASRLLSSKQKSKSSTTVATDHHLSLEPKSSHASAVVSVRHSSSKPKPDRKLDAITNTPASPEPVTLSANVRNLSTPHVQRKTSMEPSRQPTSASSHRDPSGEVQSASSGRSGSSRATISSHGPPPLKKIRSAASPSSVFRPSVATWQRRNDQAEVERIKESALAKSSEVEKLHKTRMSTPIPLNQMRLDDRLAIQLAPSSTPEENFMPPAASSTVASTAVHPMTSMNATMSTPVQHPLGFPPRLPPPPQFGRRNEFVGTPSGADVSMNEMWEFSASRAIRTRAPTLAELEAFRQARHNFGYATSSYPRAEGRAE